MRSAYRLLVIAALLVSAGAGCSHDPAGARIRYDLAIEASTGGRVQEAVRELNLAIEKDPEFPEAWNALGLLYHVSLGRPDLAEEAFNEAIDLKPGFSEAMNNLGTVYLATGRYTEAEEQFRAALDDVLYATPYLAKGNLGWALYKQGRVDEALTELKGTVITQPKFCQGHRNLGIIYEEQGDVNGARRSYEAFVQHCPDSADAHHRLGRILAALEERDAAGKAFYRCVELAGDHPIKSECVEAMNEIGVTVEPTPTPEEDAGGGEASGGDADPEGSPTTQDGAAP